MTIDELMAKAAGKVDEIIEAKLIEAADMLRAKGGTEAEVAEFLQWHRADLAAARDEQQKELRAWLARGGEPLQ